MIETAATLKEDLAPNRLARGLRFNHLQSSFNISFDSAKKRACIVLDELSKGNAPRIGKRIHILRGITLREVLQPLIEIKPIRDETCRK
ncbi:MAG: hypothetical protein JNN26_09210 [Candidatus Obscuribacter sp.]|nr:hypothetical protein [Candidatus Obscuribacter sp.]MBL8082779.1 hypothetical protein [Candidatus Obscuribacter sp.]